MTNTDDKALVDKWAEVRDTPFYDQIDKAGDAMAQRIRELSEENQALKGLLNYSVDDVNEVCSNLEGERDKLKAEVERLREYVQHLVSCEYYAGNFGEGKCTCGLDEVLSND